MHERTAVPGTAVPGTARVGPDVFASVCAGCRNEIDLHLGRRTVHGPGGTRGDITYADTDIVVWSCPACDFANADTFDE